jgi:hypothetical protein
MTATMPPRRPPRTPPRWLGPALGLWAVIVAAAVANATAVPVSAGAVTLVWGVLALGHGLVHRRWLVAGPVAVLALAATGAVSLGLVPADVHATYTGPAGASAPKLIWVALVVVVALEVAWALLLHARVRRTVGDLDGRGGQVLADRQAVGTAQLSRSLADVERHLDRVEQLLTDAG